LVLEAQNRLKFREEFRSRTGRDPNPVDYEALNSSYISPEEYSRISAAYESAESKLPEINEVVNRVLGKAYTLDDIRNMVLGGEGAGAMQAEINNALKLDSYTEAFENRYGRKPTPDEYVGFAGYSSVAQFTRRMQVQEDVAANRAEIQELFRDELGYELSEEQLTAFFGEEQGSGALKAQWKQAQTLAEEKLRKEDAAWNSQRATVPLGVSPTGGFELAVKSKAML